MGDGLTALSLASKSGSGAVLKASLIFGKNRSMDPGEAAALHDFTLKPPTICVGLLGLKKLLSFLSTIVITLLLVPVGRVKGKGGGGYQSL